MLQHYMGSIERSIERPSVLDDLGTENIYKKQEHIYPEYRKQKMGTQKERFNIHKS